MEDIKKFLNGVKGELSYIAWPTQQEAIAYTIIVIVISLVVAAYLGALDYLFIELFQPLFG